MADGAGHVRGDRTETRTLRTFQAIPSISTASSYRRSCIVGGAMVRLLAPFARQTFILEGPRLRLLGATPLDVGQFRPSLLKV